MAEHVPLEPDFLADVETNPRLKQADSLHPNAAGVRLIAERLTKAVAHALTR